MSKKPKIIRNLQDRVLVIKTKSSITAEEYAKVYNRYHQDIYRFLYFKISSPERAKELTQEVFLKVWKYIKDGQHVDNLRALFYRTARNLAIDYYRKKKSLLLEDSMQDKLMVESKIEEQIDLADDLKQLYASLKKLKQEYQEVISLRYMKGLSHRETAKVMGKTSGSVRVMLHRAIKALKKQW
jgi:RNA polymerase sigma-70 factor (ECF subfamily)